MKKLVVAALVMLVAMPGIAANRVKASKLDVQLLVRFGEFFGAWNKHDVKEMVTYWADDATFINPTGQTAKGKAEIEKLFAEEQSGAFKTSTAKLWGITPRSITPDIAWYDAEMTIDNITSPETSTPQKMKLHLVGLMQKKAGKWYISAARPYAYMASPAKKD